MEEESKTMSIAGAALAALSPLPLLILLIAAFNAPTLLRPEVCALALLSPASAVAGLILSLKACPHGNPKRFLIIGIVLWIGGFALFGAAFWVAFDVGGAYVWFPLCAFAQIIPGVVFVFRFIARRIRAIAIARNFAILDRLAPQTHAPVECPFCHALNDPGAMFCKSCRAPLAKRCDKCGARLPADAVFCDKCGATLERSRTEEGPRV